MLKCIEKLSEGKVSRDSCSSEKRENIHQIASTPSYYYISLRFLSLSLLLEKKGSSTRKPRQRTSLTAEREEKMKRGREEKKMRKKKKSSVETQPRLCFCLPPCIFWPPLFILCELSLSSYFPNCRRLLSPPSLSSIDLSLYPASREP